MGHYVITTINDPTKSKEKLYDLFGENLIIVGDKKTPKDWNYKVITPITQLNKTYAPNNHYSRKNLGYLEAMRRGAEFIYDTDDDNCPNEVWKIRDTNVAAKESVGEGWYNVYSLLSANFMWPRGFSLNNIRKYPLLGENIETTSSIQQGLSDGEPDVDAIWRLIFPKRNVFSYNKSIYLKENTWCPFNSQSTWWFPKAYPLMYLPSHASFRMTDIWRSFVAQRCLWELGEGVTFHSPAEVFQDRNEHDLLKDFEDEVPGYVKNDRIIEILSCLKLKKGEEYVCENLFRCYQELVVNRILPVEEIFSLNHWINDYENLTTNLD